MHFSLFFGHLIWQFWGQITHFLGWGIHLWGFQEHLTQSGWRMAEKEGKLHFRPNRPPPGIPNYDPRGQIWRFWGQTTHFRGWEIHLWGFQGYRNQTQTFYYGRSQNGRFSDFFSFFRDNSKFWEYTPDFLFIGMFTTLFWGCLNQEKGILWLIFLSICVWKFFERHKVYLVKKIFDPKFFFLVKIMGQMMATCQISAPNSKNWRRYSPSKFEKKIWKIAPYWGLSFDRPPGGPSRDFLTKPWSYS